MKRFRHRSMRARFAIFAIVGLLWSQLVLAAHPLCSTAAMSMPELKMTSAGGEDGCHHDKAPPAGETDETLCVAHCNQGDLTTDVARIPVVPALAAAVPVAIASFAFLSAAPAQDLGLPPPVSWHRPTAHPAALLLI